MKQDLSIYKNKLALQGFAVIENVFSATEIDAITLCIESNKKESVEAGPDRPVFAIRKLFKTLPEIKESIVTNQLTRIVHTIFGQDYFITKGLYFNKPPLSNWFVAFHQDISIAVSNKTSAASFKGWTVKDGQFGVQPPVGILENSYTIRIHLDDCTAQNGALHVIPGSHKKGICKLSEETPDTGTAVVCEVPKGGVMLMKPLLLHASHRSTVAAGRRVLHVEFCNTALPESIHWAEKEFIT